MIGTYKKNKHGLYIMSKSNIDDEAENILKQYCPECLIEPKEIDIERLIEDMGLNLCYAQMSKNSEILGAFVFNKGVIPIYNDNTITGNIYNERTIIIDAKIADTCDSRLRFTYGHELGHYVIQFDIFHINNNQLSLFDNEIEKENAVVCKREKLDFEDLFRERKTLETKEEWQEWQANYFSSCILIPKSTLKIALASFLDNYDIMDQTKLLDRLNYTKLEKIIKNLSTVYNVSNEMMKNRLKSLNYLS